MKASNVRELTTKELEAKLADLKKELFNLRLSHATGQLNNPMALNNVKKDSGKSQGVVELSRCVR